MKKVLIAAVVVAVTLMSGYALADNTSGADWSGFVDQTTSDNLFGHNHGYTDNNTQDVYEPDRFGINAGVDVVVYEDKLWELKQTNDYSTRGDGEYFVGGRVTFNAWEWMKK